MRRERVAQGMRARSLGQTDLPDGALYGPLQHRLVQVMAAQLMRQAIPINPGGGENPLPRPLPIRARVLPRQSHRQLHPTGAGRHVVRVLSVDLLEVPAEIRLDHRRQHRHSVLVAFAAADEDLVGAKVHVLNAEAATFQHAKPGAVEQARHEPGRSVEPLKHRAYFVACEHDGEALGSTSAYDLVEPWQLDFEHLAIEKEQCAQRLILGRARNVTVNRQKREEARDLRPAELGGMALAVKENVAADPRDVRLLRAAAEVTGAEGVADAVEQTGLGISSRRLAH